MRLSIISWWNKPFWKAKDKDKDVKALVDHRMTQSLYDLTIKKKTTNTIQNIKYDSFPCKYSDFKGLIRNIIHNFDQLG